MTGVCTVVVRDNRPVILQADRHIRVSRDLVAVAATAAAPGLALENDGDVLVVTADRVVRYRLVDDADPDSVAGARIDGP